MWPDHERFGADTKKMLLLNPQSIQAAQQLEHGTRVHNRFEMRGSMILEVTQEHGLTP
jgi:hypothetical protein